jgi:hypothetical protein
MDSPQEDVPVLNNWKLLRASHFNVRFVIETEEIEFAGRTDSTTADNYDAS